jgi:glycosyltransferase involved in cell wall biosynthesis
VVMASHGIQHDLLGDMRIYKETLDGVVCTNRLATSLAVEIGEIDPVRVHYASCGTAVGALPDVAPTARPKQLLYVGRLEQEQKRVFDLPQMMLKLRDVGVPAELQIVGDGPERAALEREVDRQGLFDVVIFKGAKPNTEVIRTYLPQADALLMPSHWETGPLVIWEAMAAGVPVVCSRYWGSRLEGSLRHESNCLMHEIGDVERMAAWVKRLADSPALVQQLRMNAWQLVRQRYSHEASVDMWASAFRKVLDASPRAKVDTGRPPTASGRLDRLLGPAMAEQLRRLLPRASRAGGPGDEWPHAHSNADNKSPTFWKQVEALDISPASATAVGDAVPGCSAQS